MFAEYTSRENSVAVHGAAKVVAVGATSVEIVVIIVGPSSSSDSSSSIRAY
jgi:hypothetical protein